MATQLQLRRGNTAQNDAFTGAAGEITVNTDISALRVHDGSTAGGIEIALSSQIDSLLSKNVAGAADVTLTAGEASATNHEYTGILTGDIAVIVPDTAHNFTAENLTTGTFTLTVKTAAGTGVLVPQGDTTQLYCNGTNVEDSNSVKLNRALLAAGTEVGSFTSLTATSFNLGGSGSWIAKTIGADRSSGVVYTNSTGKPLFVAITAAGFIGTFNVGSTGGAGGVNVISSSAVNVPSAVVMVPAGDEYTVTSSNLSSWAEGGM